MQTSQSRQQEIRRERVEAVIDGRIGARQSWSRAHIAVPASFFGIVLGLAGLGGAWRVAGRVWQLPSVIGEALMLIAGIVWALMLVLYAAKWIYAREEALQELVRLQKALNATSRAEVIRNALGVLRWATRHLKEKDKIIVERQSDGKQVEVDFPFLLV